MLLDGTGDGRLRAQAQRLGPGGKPPGVVELLHQDRIEGPILQPAAVLSHERVVGGSLLIIGLVEEHVGRLLQKRLLVGAHPPVVDPVGGKGGRGEHILDLQKAVEGERLEVDEQLIAGKGGAGRVRGVPPAGRTERQDLPEADTRTVEQVDELKEFLSQGADTIIRGK